MINRRNFLTGLVATLAAPAIIRTPGLLMPVRKPFGILRLWPSPEAPQIWAVEGVMAPGDLASKLALITRKAVIPEMFVQMYSANPLLTAIHPDGLLA